jgi:hypothetical protein
MRRDSRTSGRGKRWPTSRTQVLQDFTMNGNAIHSEVLAEETHSGRVWSLLVLPALIVPAISVLFFPRTPARLALIVVAVIGIGTLALIWSGFQYRFLQHGVEIRTLGITLRKIPKQSIVSYSIESWGLPRGYGIVASATPAPMCGATRSSTSRRRLERSISVTAIPRGSSAIWIR